MPIEPNSLIWVDDDALAAFIRKARKQLVVVGPAIRETVARALAEQLPALGLENVAISLDADAEHVRRGLGDVASLELLAATAKRLGVVFPRRRGIGIGLIVADDRTLIYAPFRAPDSSDGQERYHNAILMNGAVLEPLPASSTKAADRIDASTVKQLKEELQRDPPRLDPKAEMIRIFKKEFEFVELELLGTEINRKTIPISSELLGLADNADLQSRLRTSFKLVGGAAAAGLSGRELTEFKKKIVDEFLIQFKGFGLIVINSNKKALGEKVEELRQQVEAHQKNVKAELQAAMNKSRDDLVKAFLPGVKEKPLAQWRKFGSDLDDETSRKLLEELLEKAFGTAEEHVGKMQVKCNYKGVTAELLGDKLFLEVARKAIPSAGNSSEEPNASRLPHSITANEQERLFG